MDNTQTPAEQTESDVPTIFHYFLVSGEIEFVDSKFNKTRKYQKVNTVYPCPIQGLTAKHLGKCQQNLQLAFHRKYSRTHSQPPQEITDVVISSTSYLGMFTEEQFLAEAPGMPEQVSKTDQPS